jgi:hypothetical protein
MHLLDRPDSTFTSQEWARLAAYRAAIAAGFFTDWDGTTATPDTRLLARLAGGDGMAGRGGYPFTPEERQRLERLKTALDDPLGVYAEDGPPRAERSDGQGEPAGGL